MLEKITQSIQSSYTDDERRRIVVFELLNLLLTGVSLTMTVVNFHTMEYELMMVTGIFSVLCFLNFFLCITKKIKTSRLFTASTVEIVTLLVYFVMGGVPQGFSAMWTLLVPSIGMFIYGKKVGLRLNILVFLMVIFFFWTPLGRSWLFYEYHETFILRFPFVYICLFCASFYIENIRLGAYRQMQEMRENAVYLYRHDALTELYTRYAFSEELQDIFAEASNEKTSVVIFDVDDFKVINDRYGHNAGDTVLRVIAKTIRENICEHCIACRWGGEEFLVLMRCGHDPYTMAETIRKLSQDTVIVHEDLRLQVTLSVGVATAQSLSRDRLSDFINCADKAMYVSKAEGKNRTTIGTFQ